MNYIKLDQVTNILFYQVPQVLFVGKYKGMSNNARMTYAVLRDRMNLSIKNNWSDKQGNVYILFSRENLAERLGIGKVTVTKYMKELSKLELVQEKRQGVNKPNIIYVMMPVDVENTLTYNNCASRSAESECQDIQKVCPSNTNYNNTDLNNTEKSIGNENRVSFVAYLHSISRDLEEAIINCINYYNEKFMQFAKESLKYTNNEWRELSTGLFITDRDLPIEEETMIDAIDKHFATEYKYKEMYLLHNFTGTTKENRLFEVGVLG